MANNLQLSRQYVPYNTMRGGEGGLKHYIEPWEINRKQTHFVRHSTGGLCIIGKGRRFVLLSVKCNFFNPGLIIIFVHNDRIVLE